MLGKISNYAFGLGYGLGGKALSMLSRSGQAGYNLGQLGRFAASSAWATNTGRGAIIGAGAGAAWGMLSSDTSVLGGAALGAIGGASVGRYGGAAAASRGRSWNTAGGIFADTLAGGQGIFAGLGATRPYMGGIASNMGLGIARQVGADIRGVYGTGRAAATRVSLLASSSSAGTTLASNTPMGRIPAPIELGIRYKY